MSFSPFATSNVVRLPLACMAVSVLLTGCGGGGGGGSSSNSTVVVPFYSITPIPYFYAQRINNNGQIIGEAPDGDVNGPAIWKNGVTTIVGPKQAEAQGISDDGVVVGDAFDSLRDLGTYAAILSGGNATFLNIPGSSTSVAYGINSAHTIVGGYQMANPSPGHTEAFELKNGVAADLPNPPGDTASTAGNINDNGIVIGSAYNPNFRAVVWIAGVPHDLGTLGGVASSTSAVNSEGVVVGRSNVGPSGNGLPHAFSWFKGRMTDLGTIDQGAIGRGQSSDAYDINDNGLIVGNSGFNGLEHAVIWNNGAITDLNTRIGATGWVLISAVGINNRGQITGTGTYNGTPTTYLLTPLPPV